MELANYKPGDEVHILQLFQQVFDKRISLERWKWRFLENPTKGLFVKLMWDDNRLVGQNALLPQSMIIDGEKVLTGLSISTMTHPQYRGRGIFKSLANGLYKDLESRGMGMTWGYPNNNSHCLYKTKVGYRDVAMLYSLSIKATDLVALPNNYCSTTETLLPEHINLLQSSTKGQVVFVDRSAEYLKWRFEKKPESNYRIFEYRENGRCLGVAITKKHPVDDRGNLYNINILEMAFENNALVTHLLSHVLSAYQEPIYKLSLRENLFSERYSLLEKTGFVPDQPQNYLIVRPIGKQLNAVFDIRNWHLSFGDSDVF